MLTQKDIAKRLGVSPSLVSRALTGTAGDIGASEETVQRIREEAARLYYHPSAAALTLRGSQTKALGVIVRNFEDPYFGHMIGELQGLAWRQQYSLLLTGCSADTDQQVHLASLLKYHLDGVIVAGSDFEPEGLDAFSVRGIPLVQIGTGQLRKGIARVAMDQEFGLEQLVSYLEGLGHKDIGYIGDDTPPHLRREEILRAALKKHGLAIRLDAFVRVRDHDAGAGHEAICQLFHQCGKLQPTAVIAADDVIAQAGLRALFEMRIRVPADLSLAGIDDIPSARMTIPSLTTLRQPIREMISKAFHLLTRLGHEPKTRVGRETLVKPELVIRESCGAPRACKSIG